LPGRAQRVKPSFVITGDGGRADVRNAMEETLAWLRDAAGGVEMDWSRDLPLDKTDADYVVVFGGDGSIISAVRRLKGKPVPVVGINFGKFG